MPSIYGAWIESRRFMCFYLHSNEHTGWRVSLQYKLAYPRHMMHQPNLPAGISISFLISTWIFFLFFPAELYSSGYYVYVVPFLGKFAALTDLKGTDLKVTSSNSFLIISSSCYFSSISTEFSRSFIWLRYFSLTKSCRAWYRHTSSTMFCVTW